MIEDTVQLEGPIRVGPPSRAIPAAPPEEDAPVFVDTSGRRQRRVRRIGWLLAVPAAGYLGLLVSSLVGGPTIDAPFLPQAPAQASSTPTAPGQAADSQDPQSAGSTGGTPGGTHPAGGSTVHPTGPGGTVLQAGGPQPGPTATQPTATTGSTPSASASASPTHGKPTTTPSHHPKG